MTGYEKEYEIIDIPLHEEVSNGLRVEPGMVVCIDEGYGYHDRVYCRILQIATLPRLADPDCPDSSILWTFHMILEALDSSYNRVEFSPGVMIYAVQPIGQHGIYRCIPRPMPMDEYEANCAVDSY